MSKTRKGTTVTGPVPPGNLAAMAGRTPAAETIVGEWVSLSTLLPGDRFAANRREAAAHGFTLVKTGKKGERAVFVQVAQDGSDDPRVLAVAAVSRTPGPSYDYLLDVSDFQPTTRARGPLVKQYWRLYREEGMLTQAIDKIAAVLAGEGAFKVVRTRRGRGSRSPAAKLLEILNWWQMNVNTPSADGVVTGARGLRAVVQQGSRRALIEGSWLARTAWRKVDVPNIGKVALPMNIQALGTDTVEPVRGTVGTGIELFDWKPSSDFLNFIRSSDPDVQKVVRRYVDSKLLSQLLNGGRARLDSALLMHVKFRGSDDQAFGESFIQPTVSALAYRRAVEALDLVMMQSLINRLVIVKVGSSDRQSPYSKPEVAQQRTQLMQQLFDDPGPNMTIIWQGDDVTVETVGANDSVLALDERHAIGDRKVEAAMGLPKALLAGSTSDGKASGWAAMLSTSAQMAELKGGFEVAIRTLGERIAYENGFEDTQLIFEFGEGMILDRVEEMNQSRQDYRVGGISIHTFLRKRGLDPDAEFRLRAEEKGLDPDDESVTWETVFAPPVLPGDQGQGMPQDGRTPNNEQVEPPPAPPAERRTTRERS